MIERVPASRCVTPVHGGTAPTRSSAAVPPDPNGTLPVTERSDPAVSLKVLSDLT
jgi:hypothetical protein